MGAGLLPERGRSRTGWTVLGLQGDHTIDLATVDEALAPDFVNGSPRWLKVPTNPEDWSIVDRSIATAARELMTTGTFRPAQSRFPGGGGALHGRAHQKIGACCASPVSPILWALAATISRKAGPIASRTRSKCSKPLFAACRSSRRRRILSKHADKFRKSSLNCFVAADQRVRP